MRAETTKAPASSAIPNAYFVASDIPPPAVVAAGVERRGVEAERVASVIPMVIKRTDNCERGG